MFVIIIACKRVRYLCECMYIKANFRIVCYVYTVSKYCFVLLELVLFCLIFRALEFRSQQVGDYKRFCLTNLIPLSLAVKEAIYMYIRVHFKF